MKKKSSDKTASEFMAELQHDQKYQQMIREKEKKRMELERLLNQDEELLIHDLEASGVKVSSVWDLVNTKESYSNAIPILIEHLSKEYYDKNKEGIIRALAVKEAKGLAGPALLAEYQKTTKEKTDLRWVIGNTMEVVISNSDVEEILKIVKNKSNGQSRHMFILALGKVKMEKAEETLIDLLDDEETVQYALEALCKLKSKKAKDKINKLLNHPKPLIRKEAKNVLKKIG